MMNECSMDRNNSHCDRKNGDDLSLKWDLMNFADPRTAVKCSKKESIVYVSCINPRKDKPDYLAVVDVDDNSPTFCKVVHRVHMPGLGDEVHHFGWNHCVGCRCNPNMKRSHLLMPSLNTNQIHVIDATKPKKPKYYKTIDLNEHNISFPHTVHCLPNGKVMVSFMGDGNDEAQGNFVVIDGETFEFEGKWSNENAPFGYDFWYKPNLNILISSSWGPPSVIKRGLLEKSDLVKYGHYLYVWDYTTKKRIQTIDLGLDDGCMALEVRMCHEPQSSHGYVVTGIGGSIFHFWQESEKWNCEIVVKEEGAVFTDSLISMDDKYLFVSAWIPGYIRQYDISDKFRPKLINAYDAGQKKPRMEGGCQMVQLSIDGRRLYVTDSLYSGWDQKFYPNLIQKGSTLLRINVDNETKEMKCDESFCVKFEHEPDGPVLAHEIRYPGGDCTSDIFV